MPPLFFHFLTIASSWFNECELEMNGTATMVPKRDNLQAVKVHQIDKDAIVVCYENIVQIVNLQGLPKQSKKYVAHLNFEFNVDGIGEISFL